MGRGRGRIINGKLRGAHTSFLAVFISLIFFAGSAAAQERQTIEWYQIFPGQDRDDFFENLLTLYQTTLSGYEHSEVDAIPRRFLEDAKSKPHACTSTLLWAKSREKVLVYSKPYLAPLSQGVLISKAKAKAKRFTPYVDDHGRYDIDAILSAGLQIGMVPGRTYGKEIDAIVARHADSPVLVPLHYNPKNVLAILLKRDSLDGLFAFPGEYGSAVEELKAENDLVFLQPQQKTTGEHLRHLRTF